MKIKLLLVLQLIILNSVHSQIGDLDTTFGVNGIVTTDVSNNLLDDRIFSVLVKDNGSILVTGDTRSITGDRDFALTQYDSNGALDTSFGTNGITTLDINNQDDRANQSALQSDGKIITVGEGRNTTTDIIIARFNSNGILDNSYGVNGIFTYDSGDGDFAKSIAVLPDNKVIIGSRIFQNYVIMKITETGSLDNSFGTNGIVTTDLGYLDIITDLKVHSDGKILITGFSSRFDSVDDTEDKTLIRYNSDGSLDTSFNNTGIIFSSFEDGKKDRGQSISIQPDGKIVITGTSEDDLGYKNIALSRYNNNGSIDSSFGTNGTTFTNYSDDDYSYSSLIQSDGKIVIGGFSYNDSTSQRDFILVRYNSDGNIDNTFGNNGITTTDLNNNSSDYGFSLAFQSDNKLLIAGFTYENGGTLDSVIARYTINGNLGFDDFNNNPKSYLVYPNPAVESITIINNTFNNEKVNIEIYSVDGKKLKYFTNYNLDDNQNIPLSYLVKGVYILKISNNRTSEILKIIKK
ncbi:T9SS type A sorting domain-containing protein [Winogradskyella sp. PAMC22761]|nr:T9SS type A sorting domain-containing protein [Winogradskyella sp. PAMC22761]